MATAVRIINVMTNATDGDVRGLASDFVDSEGVLNLAGGHLQVAQSATPGMSVQVAAGIAYVGNDSFTEFSGTLKYWDVIVDAIVSPAISSNSSGLTRIDLVCLKIDTAATPNANATNVASVIVVAGTPGAGQPATPSNHLLLAVVTVADGSTSIVNANITDSRSQVEFKSVLIPSSSDTKALGILVYNDEQEVVIGDGAGDVFLPIPSVLNGWELIGASAHAKTAGTTGTNDIQIHNVTQAVDMLTTKITIDSGETSSLTAAVAAVVSSSNDDVATGDQIRIDVDDDSTTKAKGLFIWLYFQDPTPGVS